jgi:nucleotidyltransferase substrate binding protein (TIGR01987 family)
MIFDPSEQKPRWVYRFDNYQRAFMLLREAMEILEQRPMTMLEREGVIQRFEYTWELAWKVLKDYLEAQGVVLDKITPLSVIRAAFAAKIITQGTLWMQALDDRNKMAHTYDVQHFEHVIQRIYEHYFALFDALHSSLLEVVQQEDYSAGTHDG